VNQKNPAELPAPATEYSIVELPLYFVAVEPDLPRMPSKGSFRRIAADFNDYDIGNAVTALALFQQEPSPEAKIFMVTHQEVDVYPMTELILW
jgi:hypothetical protein